MHLIQTHTMQRNKKQQKNDKHCMVKIDDLKMLYTDLDSRLVPQSKGNMAKFMYITFSCFNYSTSHKKPTVRVGAKRARLSMSKKDDPRCTTYMKYTKSVLQVFRYLQTFDHVVGMFMRILHLLRESQQ